MPFMGSQEKLNNSEGKMTTDEGEPIHILEENRMEIYNLSVKIMNGFLPESEKYPGVWKIYFMDWQRN